ncbi:MAG: RluA family pseudouridine synthase [Myxococcaceae bacterium]
MSQTLSVDPGAAGERLDRYVVSRISELSRARVQALIEAGQVRVDGKAARASHRLRGAETIEVEVPAPEPIELKPEAIPLSVVFQDKHLLVLDKPAGLVVHPGAGNKGGTLVNALLHHVKDLAGIGGELRPGIVHRLDKDTSGLMVVAKTQAALEALQKAFASREVDKRYLALVAGRPADSGEFDTLHGRDPRNRLKFSGRVKRGKQAVTRFAVRRRFAEAALVEIELLTGRTHQIRMHFAEAGFPLLGDALYGGRKQSKSPYIARQALHAASLSFAHPKTGKPLSFKAEPPADFARAISRLSRT